MSESARSGLAEHAPADDHGVVTGHEQDVTALGFPVVDGDVLLTHDPIKRAGGYY